MRLSWIIRTTSAGWQAQEETESICSERESVLTSAKGRKWNCWKRPEAECKSANCKRDQKILRVDVELRVALQGGLC